MKRIAIINQKGGVGKTTTAANLGAALGRSGNRVLLLDLDSQSNLTMHLSGELDLGATSSEPTSTGRSMFELLVDGTPLDEVARELPDEQLWIAPGSGDLAGIEQALSQHIGRELILRDALDAMQTRFDVVLMDCPPSLGVLSLNALAAADSVLIPLQAEFFALQGMTQLLEVVRVVESRLNPALGVLGILPCMVDQRTNLAQEVIAEIRTHFAELVFDTRVRKNVKLAEAPSFGQSILRYAPESNGAEDYLLVAQEFRRRLGLVRSSQSASSHSVSEQAGEA